MEISSPEINSYGKCLVEEILKSQSWNRHLLAVWYGMVVGGAPKYILKKGI